MSHSYETRTFTVPTHELPSSFSSLEDYDNFAREAGGVAHARTDGWHHVWGSTRSGWAICLTGSLVRAAPNATSLHFLGDDINGNPERQAVGYIQKFESEYGFTAVAVIDSAAVDQVAEQLDGLLSLLRAEPGRIYDADYAGIFYGDDVDAALPRDYVSAKPAYDDQVFGDEGQSADYLLTYLRSVLALLRAAQAQGLSVVHALTV